MCNWERVRKGEENKHTVACVINGTRENTQQLGTHICWWGVGGPEKGDTLILFSRTELLTKYYTAVISSNRYRYTNIEIYPHL